MPRWFAAGLVACCALALSVRVVWIVAVDPTVPEVGDAQAYHLLADGLAAGDGYVRPFDRVLFDVHRPTAEYPPLHPAVLAVADLAGVDSVRGQRLWLALFGAASVAVTGLAARRLVGVATAPRAAAMAGLVAAAIGAVHPLWFQFDATLMSETVTALLGAVVLLTALRLVDSFGVGRLAAAGAACGLAALARADAAVLLPAVAMPAAIAAARTARPLRRRPAASAALVVVAAGLVVTPWLWRSASRFGEAVPISTNAGSVIDGANCAATYGGPLLGSWSYSSDCFEGFTQDELAVADEAAVSRAHRRAGQRYAFEHVARWPLVTTARLLRTIGAWNPGQQADLGRLEGRSQAADLAGYALVWVSLGAGTVGALRLRRIGRPWWVPAAAVGSVWLATGLSYGNPRFLASAQPSLAALAAVGVVALAGRRWPPDLLVAGSSPAGEDPDDGPVAAEAAP